MNRSKVRSTMVHFSTTRCSESSSYTRIGGPYSRLGRRKSTAQGGVPYLWPLQKNRYMKEQVIRTIVDIPASLFRKLKEQAAAQGRSVRRSFWAYGSHSSRASVLVSKGQVSPHRLMGQKSICPTNRSMNTLSFLDADGSAVGSTYSLRNGAGVPGEVARREVLFSADSRS